MYWKFIEEAYSLNILLSFRSKLSLTYCYADTKEDEKVGNFNIFRLVVRALFISRVIDIKDKRNICIHGVTFPSLDGILPGIPLSLRDSLRNSRDRAMPQVRRGTDLSSPFPLSSQSFFLSSASSSFYIFLHGRRVNFYIPSKATKFSVLFRPALASVR